MSDLAQGTVFKQTISASLTNIIQIHNIQFSSTRDDNDISFLSGGVQRDFLPGLIDEGSVEISYRFDPNGTTHRAITTEYLLTTTNACQIVWSDTTVLPLTCYIKGVSYSAVVGGVLEGTATYKVADAIVFPT